MNALSRATQRVVYRFLAWFESFDSVWQTTLLCAAVAVFEIGWPSLDPHLVAVLLVSLYATFTQNGLAHGNKLTSQKLDQALAEIDRVGDENYVSTQALLQFAKNEEHLQQAVIEQGQAITAALAELRTGLAELRLYISDEKR